MQTNKFGVIFLHLKNLKIAIERGSKYDATLVAVHSFASYKFLYKIFYYLKKHISLSGMSVEERP
jgi:hypothetical protein